MRTAILWETEGDRIRCGLCPNACLIACGKTGTCGVRSNVDGVLEATTYGRISSIAVDPIEKKPVFHYHPGTAVLSHRQRGLLHEVRPLSELAYQSGRAGGRRRAARGLPRRDRRHGAASIAVRVWRSPTTSP